MSIPTSNDNPEVSAANMTLNAVGIIKNEVKEPFLKAGEKGIKMEGELDDVAERVDKIKHALSEIVIHPEYAGLLQGVDEFSHLIVLYWAHKVPSGSRSLTRIHPMGREEIPEQGIFATCSPARPNPVLVTVVKVRGRKDNVLTVAGLDAVDQSPVIDLKPYVPKQFPQEGVVISDWMQRILDEMADTAPPA